MHKIKINNLKVFGFHGVYKNEEKEGQNFYIEIEYVPRENIERINDNIDNVTDYMSVRDDFITLFNKKRYSLIELLGRDLLNQLIDIYDFIYLKITIRKKIILSKNKIDYVSVEIEKNNA